MERKCYSHWTVLKLVGALCFGALVGGVCLVRAQPAQVYRVTDSKIMVDTQGHWEHWTMPRHVLDITSDGVVRPHAFRRIYNLIEEDRETFRRAIEQPNIRRDDRVIMSIGRTLVRTRDGDLKLEEQKVGKYLNSDFRRFPGNETQIVLGGQLYTVTDTSMSGAKEVTLLLKNVSTGVRSTRKFETKDKENFPAYDYFVQTGISRVGSNPDDAPNIIDGNPTTYWEPDLAANSTDWWVEIDLGRVVVVEKIVLHFVDEETGDPFRQFRVLVSPEQEFIEDADNKLDFSLVGGTVAPNTEQRTFVLSTEEEPRFAQSASDPKWTGRIAETIRILVTDSKRFRARQLSKEEWEVLPSEEQGDILYYIQDETGFEEPVDQSTYEGLGPERQGRKGYYIRERPRLSEVEVWGWGDNLAPGVLGKGGSVDLTGPYIASNGFDGDASTNFRWQVWSPLSEVGIMTVDMGALVWLDAMRLAGSVDGYIVQASDGARDARGELKWRRVSPVERENNEVDRFRHFADFYDPPLRIRYLGMRLLTTNLDVGGGYRVLAGTVSELQFFSEGYITEAEMTSDFIRMPGPRSLGAVRWSPEDQPEGTSVEIRTRTGDLLVEQIRYFDASGFEKTQKEWEELFSKYQGPVDTSFALGGGWSPWSRKYVRSGERVTSPGLRNFMQLQVKFTSEDRWKTASIGSIEVELFDPVAQRVVGEVWPQETIPGRLDTFEIYLRPTFIDAPFSAQTAGFDEMLLSAPEGVDLHLLSVSTGTEEEFREGQVYQNFQRVSEGGFLSASGDALDVFREGGDSLWVRLPASMQSVPVALAPKVYNRVTSEGDEVPVGHDGDILTEAAYGLLPDSERGRSLFFKKTTDSVGNLRFEEVANQFAYDELDPEKQGPVRYFRKLVGAGAEFSFDARGDSLTPDTYNALERSVRGTVIGTGRLVQVRFASTVFLNGTTLKAFVRKADQISDAGDFLWQQVDPGDATILTSGSSLTISVPVGGKIIDELVLSPNPFTPNGDGVNDVLEVAFSVFRVTAEREARMRIYALDGRLMWEDVKMAHGGPHVFRWTGVDKGGSILPPGLYICQIHLGADSGEAKGKTLSLVVAVAY